MRKTSVLALARRNVFVGLARRKTFQLVSLAWRKTVQPVWRNVLDWIRSWFPSHLA